MHQKKVIGSAAGYAVVILAIIAASVSLSHESTTEEKFGEHHFRNPTGMQIGEDDSDDDSAGDLISVAYDDQSQTPVYDTSEESSGHDEVNYIEGKEYSSDDDTSGDHSSDDDTSGDHSSGDHSSGDYSSGDHSSGDLTLELQTSGGYDYKSQTTSPDPRRTSRVTIKSKKSASHNKHEATRKMSNTTSSITNKSNISMNFNKSEAIRKMPSTTTLITLKSKQSTIHSKSEATRIMPRTTTSITNKSKISTSNKSEATRKIPGTTTLVTNKSKISASYKMSEATRKMPGTTTLRLFSSSDYDLQTQTTTNSVKRRASTVGSKSTKSTKHDAFQPTNKMHGTSRTIPSHDDWDKTLDWEDSTGDSSELVDFQSPIPNADTGLESTDEDPSDDDEDQSPLSSSLKNETSRGNDTSELLYSGDSNFEPQAVTSGTRRPSTVTIKSKKSTSHNKHEATRKMSSTTSSITNKSKMSTSHKSEATRKMPGITTLVTNKSKISASYKMSEATRKMPGTTTLGHDDVDYTIEGEYSSYDRNSEFLSTGHPDFEPQAVSSGTRRASTVSGKSTKSAKHVAFQPTKKMQGTSRVIPSHDDSDNTAEGEYSLGGHGSSELIPQDSDFQSPITNADTGLASTGEDPSDDDEDRSPLSSSLKNETSRDSDANARDRQHANDSSNAAPLKPENIAPTNAEGEDSMDDYPDQSPLSAFILRVTSIDSDANARKHANDSSKEAAQLLGNSAPTKAQASLTMIIVGCLLSSLLQSNKEKLENA